MSVCYRCYQQSQSHVAALIGPSELRVVFIRPEPDAELAVTLEPGSEQARSERRLAGRITSHLKRLTRASSANYQGCYSKV